jgi:hypothetical protein
VSDDFETVREPDDFESERPDPEEPQTWQHAGQRVDMEIDELDWADQHSAVEAPLPEDEAVGADTETASDEHVRPD